ncbi:MAG: Ni,Fe-hydrogenase III large subunit [Steroidobacteraceae bacterium]|nr:Ni,Fe-hydrogenase III large subunit [Steroidobacteraceae bacterium]
MPLRAWDSRFGSLPGAPGLQAIRVSREEWRPLAQDLLAARFRLLALWASRGANSEAIIHAVFFGERGALLVSMPVTPEERYVGLEDLFPAASRMQRAIADLSGLHSTDEDNRPWLRHASWPAGFRPLVDAEVPALAEPVADTYAFVSVEGDGVHEIPVGPIHAGTIEPGHFRFSVVGEKVLRLEERLGYVHKGIERRFTELPILEAHRLAARVSGDSAVAFSWAYCQALEGMSGVQIPARAAWLRALALELERIANHLGDLGALGNDAGFAFGLAQFSRLKEDLLRATHDALGARYLMGLIVPGGTRLDLSEGGADRLRSCVRTLTKQVSELRAIYDDHEGVRDRFIGAGTVAPPLATRLGLIGLAGRASGQALDLRVDLPCEPYTELSPVKVCHNEGDVAARVAVRFDETLESCALVERILATMPAGAHIEHVQAPAAGSLGIGLIEGWRGPVLMALEAGVDGSIRRCHPHDPSWQNWPVLEHAIIDNIVPDFPLINKSFNLAYSGHDL